MMPPSRKVNIRVPAAIDQAVEVWCEAHGINLSQYILAAMCEKMGRPELLETVRPEGRPRNDEQPAPPKRRRGRPKKGG